MHAWLDICCGAFNRHWVTDNVVQYGIQYIRKKVNHLVTINALIMKLNNEQRAIVLRHVQAGDRLVDVDAQFNVAPKTIRNLHSRYSQTGHVQDRPHRSHRKVTMRSRDNFIRSYTLRNHFATFKAINQALQNAAPAGMQKISNKTVKRRLLNRE